nr:pseudaminic acid synthase [Moraxella atlantae]
MTQMTQSLTDLDPNAPLPVATSLSIGGRKIGAGEPPYIIAEMSANHNGSLDNAYKIIDMAKACGADAVKMQTYTPDTITLDSNAPEFHINGGLWHGRTLYDLYREAHTPWDWHKPLFEYARQIGITIFSSPFDVTAVDLLEELNAPAYKIASFEAVDLPLIRYAASTGKPLIISTGMADKDEIGEAVAAAYDGGCRQLALLHCVSGYPAPAADYNLRTILDMQAAFGVPIGLSDHTLDNTTAITSIALGACIIEKHVTLDRNGGGADDSFSLQADELAVLCRDSYTAWQALGRVDYGRKSSEQGNVQFRRSLYFVQDMQAGEVVTAQHIRSVRPGFGVPPKFYDAIIGKRVTTDIAANTAVSWDVLATDLTDGREH